MMNLFLQQLISGIATGSLFAMLALAVVLIYRTTGALNFAQGEIAMFTTFIAWSLLQIQLSFWMVLVVTLLLAAGIGAALEWLLLRRVENGSPLNIIIVTIGLFTIFNGLALWIWGAQPRGFGPFGLFMGKPLCVQELCLSRLDAGILFTALLVMMLLFFFFRYTDLGLAMRATAQNPLASRLVGIPVGRMLAVGWALSTVVGALAGILTAQSLGLDINLMSSVLLFAFTAAVLGGLDSPFGAVVSGLLIGVLKNLAGAYAPQLLGNVDLTIAFAVIVLVLLLRPTGLFGQQAYHRV